jgi:hypothetical protein
LKKDNVYVELDNDMQSFLIPATAASIDMHQMRGVDLRGEEGLNVDEIDVIDRDAESPIIEVPVFIYSCSQTVKTIDFKI